MVSYDPPYGFPLRRNGTCLSSETSCGGHTWGNFHACCPGNSVCPGASRRIPNNVCCPSEADCTDPLDQSPHCAIANGTMFNHTGYFCCLPGQTGFWTDNPKDAVGCSNGVPDDSGYSILNPISYNISVTTTSSPSSTVTSSVTSSTSAASSAATTSASDSSADSSSNHSGAIAGGVVGGVGGLAVIGALVWYLLHRRRKNHSVPPPAGEPGAPRQYQNLHPGELHGHSVPAELDNMKDMQIHELPAER